MRSEFLNVPQSSKYLQPFKPMKSETDYRPQNVFHRTNIHNKDKQMNKGVLKYM